MSASPIGNITIWLNLFKKEDEQPDYRGKGIVDGREVTFALWINREMRGVPVHLSGQICPPHPFTDSNF